MTAEASEHVAWARRELERAGLFDEGSDYGGMLGEEVMKMVEVFSEAGHSGSSAACVAEIFGRLAEWKPLTPLTSDPGEWMHVEEGVAGDAVTWQSRRSPSCFSGDGGRTYYDVGERQSWWRRLAMRGMRRVRRWEKRHRSAPRLSTGPEVPA